MKDDFDKFVEEAEKLIKLHEAGYDVTSETEQLSKLAFLVDPSTVPSTSVDPIAVSKMLADSIKLKRPPVVPVDQNVRQRNNTQPSSQKNNIITYSTTKPNSSPCLRFFVCIIIFIVLCFIYYLQWEPPCPRPIW